MFDFSGITVPKEEDMVIDPIALFQRNKGKISDSGINDLWLAQGDALREWHLKRDKNDIGIVLNTGAGKTLIGLLISQSLVNETKGKVIFVCGSIQLIEQTREKAEGYGIPVTTYHSGGYSNDLFQQGKAPCLTTYQAIFNGKSKFAKQDISAIIFDDAHTAEGVIKNHFSINIDRKKHLDLFTSLTNLFRNYYNEIDRLASFDELIRGYNERVELLPPSVVNSNVSEIHRLFQEHVINSSGENLFSWEYLKDHLNLCGFFVSSGSIQITPPFLPTSILPYFQSSVRRVYLTATMLSVDSFVRTFGKTFDSIIKPITTAGECERLIFFPSKVLGSEDEINNTASILSDFKTLVLTPNTPKAVSWNHIGNVLDRSNAVVQVDEFKHATDNRKLILAGRYDGIDLPGDSCRSMVLDGLPSGSSLYDRFLWSSLSLGNVLRSVIGARVIQSLGRISRGMSDYGIVAITDKTYLDWLLNRKNMAVLPGFVQKQIKLGLELTKQFTNEDDIKQAINGFMARNESWLRSYDDFMNNCPVEAENIDENELLEFAKAEVKFSRHYWNRDYGKALKAMLKVLDSATNYNSSLAAWYYLWCAYCYELMGDQDNSNLFYKHAYNFAKTLPKPISIDKDVSQFPQQISYIETVFEIKNTQVTMPSKIYENLKYLDGTGSTNQTEESIRYLGIYLGLNSTRPDNEGDIGPDNLWWLDGVALVIEAKTGKKATNSYDKDNVGQLSQHINWVKENYKDINQTPVFVGHKVSVTSSASPSADMGVISLETLNSLGQKVISAYADIQNKSLPIDLKQKIFEVFRSRGMLWPSLLEQLDISLLSEIDS